MSETNELRIAVIGAGPAGVYSSDIFLRQLGKLGEELGLGTKARIDLFEKLPVPFGLVRYGVAPDHPSIKFIASALEKTLDNPDIHLYCDVEFGKDVTLDELLERYDAVLFAPTFRTTCTKASRPTRPRLCICSSAVAWLRPSSPCRSCAKWRSCRACS